MNRLKTSLLLCILLALGSARIATAQGIPSEGRDFYLGYLHPSFNDVVPAQTAGFFRVYAFVSSFQDNVVSVSYFDPITRKEDYPSNYPVRARQTTQIPLDRTRMTMKNPGDIAGEFKSCHITSKKPVNVQFFSTGANSGGSYLALPVNALGKEYVIASYGDNGSGAGSWLGGRGPASLDLAGGYFMVIAAYDNTSVTIIPTALTGGNHVGVRQGAGANGTPRPYTVGLNRGQCWMVKSKSASLEGDDDISSSIVRSDKPVAVIAGHEDANVGDGTVGGRNLEARDYMVEQMIPVEYWDNTGIITIPMTDSPSNNGEGEGEDIGLFVYDKDYPTVITAERDGGVTIPLQTGPYQAPPSYLNNSSKPTHFYSDPGTKFMAVQYDLRNHGAGAPFPSPSMMSIVPRSMWRNAYLWYVPTNVNERLQAYYITLIATKDGTLRYHEPSGLTISRNWFSDSIRVSLNGGTPGRVNLLGSSRKTWQTIPGHPDLRAVTYQVSPGTSYYVQAPFPFMVYNFGDRGVDYDGDLGDFDNDDNFFTYALPLGMSLSKPIPKRMRITVDTLCAGWRVCVHDSNDPGGVKTVTLLDDPNGDIIVGGKYQYKNTLFDAADDPLNLKEITLNPAKRDYCFNVRVENPGADAYAPLYIVDVNGNGYIVQLRYKKASVMFIPPDSVGLVFKMPYVREDMCKDYLFINKKESPRAYMVTKVEIPQPSPFRITNITPPPGSMVEPDDTMTITVCFNAVDTMLAYDSIEFETDCFPARLPLVGQAGTPLIIADDHDFGTILIGTRKCADVEVKNVGNKPFIIDSNWVLTNFSEFIFDRNDAKNQLPKTLGPGQKHKFRFCYQPTDEGRDSSTKNWETDIIEPYDKDIKSFSDLDGAGIKPGVNWDRATEHMQVICEHDTVHRVNLMNTSTASAQLTRIWFDGPDADEFSIVATQYNTNPPTYAGTVIDTAQTMWVDVRFTPNLSKTPTYRLRTAFLKTAGTYDTNTVPMIAFTGEIDHAIPNPARIDNSFADTLHYGYLNIAQPSGQVLKITNTGDSPLIIESFIAPGAPYLDILPDLTTMLPLVIDTGVTVSFTIRVVMNTYGDTVLPFILNYRDAACSPQTVVQLEMAANNNAVLLGLPPHPPTYIGGCRSAQVDGSIENRGFNVALNLLRVDIVDGAPGLDNSGEFTFAANGQRTLTFTNKVLNPGDRELIPIKYDPTMTGAVGAWLKFTWDSAGVKTFTDSVEIHASGVLLQNTFSVENSAGGPFTTVTNEFFAVPVRILDNIQGPVGGAPPGARGATFKVTWRGDLFKFIKNELQGKPGFDATVVDPPAGSPNDVNREPDGTEWVMIHVESLGGDITSSGDLADIVFQLMIATEESTDITISDGVFTDAGGTVLCYFANQHIPGTFVPVDRCGDNVIREFLRGNKPTSISYLTPNPVVPGSTMKLGYRVNVPLTPVTVEIYDVMGDKVRTVQAQKFSAKGDHNLTIPTDGLAAGAYTVRVSGTTWSETSSFVIEK